MIKNKFSNDNFSKNFRFQANKKHNQKNKNSSALIPLIENNRKDLSTIP